MLSGTLSGIRQLRQSPRLPHHTWRATLLNIIITITIIISINITINISISIIMISISSINNNNTIIIIIIISSSSSVTVINFYSSAAAYVDACLSLRQRKLSWIVVYLLEPVYI